MVEVVTNVSPNWPGNCHKGSQAGDSIPRQTGWTCDRTRTCSDTSPGQSRSDTPAHTASACLCLGSDWRTGSTLACPTVDTASPNTPHWCTTVERQIIKISARLGEESCLSLLLHFSQQVVHLRTKASREYLVIKTIILVTMDYSWRIKQLWK